MKRILLSLLASSVAFAAGYKIPEQSSDAVALSAANVAYSFGADAAYYNPANMAFLQKNKNFIAGGLTYIHLGEHTFMPDDQTKRGSVSKAGNFFVPNLHFVSQELLPNLRVGASLAVPSGMSMEWTDKFGASTAKRFKLEVVEFAPSVSYEVLPGLSAAVGVRALYAKAKVATYPNGGLTGGVQIDAQRDLTGDALNFGWNVALAYKPHFLPALSVGLTYRSLVNLEFEGDARISSKTTPVAVPGLNGDYTGGVKTNLPMPANLNLGVAYEWRNFVFMLDYERTFWSKYKELKFSYDEAPSATNGLSVFSAATKREWKDTSTYRAGFSWNYDKKLRLMFGFAYDESAASDERVGLELPDTSSRIYSFGANYKFTPNLEGTFSYLYQDRLDRHFNSASIYEFANVVGEMKSGDAQLVSLGVKYAF